MFPGISAPGRSWSGRLGLDSGMVLSGTSGTAGFAFGTVGNKTHTEKLSLDKLHMLNYNDLFSATPRITFIIFWYIFCVGRRLSLRVLKAFHRQRWKHKKRKDKLASVCETRQHPCPAVKNPKKRAHIYISSSFSKHSDSHFQHWHIHETHTHTAMRTHQCTHLQYTYNTLRHGRMRVK